MSTSLVARRLTAEIPKRMRTLPRDSRGYPIPHIVFIDKTKQPQFTINDHAKVLDCLKKKLCAICGKRMDLGFWFVGGERSFLNEAGAFLDPPSHLECAEYALKVCPFLCAHRYTNRLDDALIRSKAATVGIALTRNEFMISDLPARFGLGWTRSYRVVQRGLSDVIIWPAPWDYLEFWREGAPCAAPDSALPELDTISPKLTST